MHQKTSMLDTRHQHLKVDSTGTGHTQSKSTNTGIHHVQACMNPRGKSLVFFNEFLFFNAAPATIIERLLQDNKHSRISTQLMDWMRLHLQLTH
eukprot:g22352.t1